MRVGAGVSETRTDGAPVATAQDIQTWLDGFLAGGEALGRGAELLRQVSAHLGYNDTKLLVVGVLRVLREREPEQVAPLFGLLETYLRGRLAEVPAHQRAEELQRLDKGQLRVDVSAQVNLAASADLQAALAEQLAKTFAAEAPIPPAEEARPSQRSRAVASQLALRSGSAEAVGALQAVERSGLSRDAWGAFLGRAISNVQGDHEGQALDVLFAQGRYDKALYAALQASGVLKGARAVGRAERICAAIDLARRCAYGSGADALDHAVLAVVSRASTKPIGAAAPLSSSHDGDLEDLLLRWISVTVPGLKGAVLDHHPLLALREQLVGVTELAQSLRAEHGKFLEGFEVLTIMHQLGSTAGWLDVLHAELGLDKESYLGLSVPYSGSGLGLAKLDRDGWTTLRDHDPREPMLALVQDTLGGGNPKPFDELKEAAVKKALEKLLDRQAESGKRLMIIDDGGYAAALIRKLFPERESEFVIIEWTTRGIRKFEGLTDPKLALVAAAESGPKLDLEPAFIADASCEALRISLEERVGSLAGKRLTVVGNGAIGHAVALALAAEGAEVRVTDKDPRKLRLSQDDRRAGLNAEPDLQRALSGAEIVIGATGANSLPPEVLHVLPSGVVAASVSSVDIETRAEDNRLNGRWGHGLRRLSIRFSDEPGGPTAVNPNDHPVTRAAMQSLETQLGAVGASFGMSVAVEQRDILNGGFPINLVRRARLMSLPREELVLMNVTAALARAATVRGPGKHSLDAPKVAGKSTTSELLVEIYGKHHPEELTYARDFAKRAAKS